jgi:hypothetical protein
MRMSHHEHYFQQQFRPFLVMNNMGVMTACESKKGFSFINNFVNWLPSTSILMLFHIPILLLFITARCHFWVFYSANWYVHNLFIWNNLKTSKKWKLQGSWNGTIVLQEDYKGCMLQMLQSQNYDLQQLTKVQGSVHSKTMKGDNERQLKTTPLYTIS